MQPFLPPMSGPLPPGPGAPGLSVLRHPDNTLALSVTADDRRVLRLGGELDMYSAPLLRDHIAAVITNTPDRSIVLDLCGVTFIDTAGLDALLEAQALLASQGRCLTLWAISPSVAQLLSLTGHAQTFARRTGQDSRVARDPSGANGHRRSGTPP